MGREKEEERNSSESNATEGHDGKEQGHSPGPKQTALSRIEYSDLEILNTLTSELHL